MESESIKQAIRWAIWRSDEGNTACPKDAEAGEMHIARALLIRDAQLKIALEALEKIDTTCDHDLIASCELCDCSTPMSLDASRAITEIRGMETK